MTEIENITRTVKNSNDLFLMAVREVWKILQHNTLSDTYSQS